MKIPAPTSPKKSHMDYDEYSNTKFYEASKISRQDISTFLSGSSRQVVQGTTRMQSLEVFEVCFDEPEIQYKII